MNRIIRLLMLLPLLLSLGSAPARAADAEPGPQVLRQAGFQALDAAGEALPAVTPQTVALPDDWGQRGQPRPGQGRYTLQFEVPAVQAEQPWALWSQRLPMRHRVLVNGRLLSQRWSHDPRSSPRTAPLLLAIPPALLQAGRNELQIDEFGGARAGLSPLWVGPEAEVASQARVWRRLTLDLPRAINGAAAGAALFALLLWLRRRRETIAGWFGVFGLLMSLRNLGFVEQDAPTPAGGSLLLFAMTCAVSLLFAFFAASVAGRNGRWLRQVATGLALVCAGALVYSRGDTATLDGLRVWVYPLLFVGTVPAVALLLHATWRHWSQRQALLAGACALLLGSGLHDYLLQTGRLPQDGEFLFPWTAPLLALAYALVMASRVVQALQTAEQSGAVLEQRVRERTVELQSANEAKSRFLAAASHDLRQPLVAIGLLVDLLREQLISPAQQALVARVDEAVAAMESLLRGLLDLSRLDSATVPVRRQPVPLQPLLQAVVSHEGEAARIKGLRLRTRVSARAATALGDPLLLEQILRNLVANAVRYTDRGGVLVAARPRAGGVCLQVWDSGPGIAAEARERIFEDFVQLDNAHRARHQGLGLGLAIVRRAARALGTQVTLRTQPGRGSCFALQLEAARATAPRSPQPEPAALRPPATASGLPLAGLRIWLVEDEAAVRRALCERLQAWGAQVQDFGDPLAVQQALAASPAPHPPQLLLTDMRLPGADGVAVASLLRSHHPLLPVLVVTGNTAPGDLQTLRLSGLPTLHKPFRADELLAQILRLLAPSSAGPGAPP